tara:strand:- start:190 stop:456 length:267 start_codon:yes stop_codon:yes gene_type:complete
LGNSKFIYKYKPKLNKDTKKLSEAYEKNERKHDPSTIIYTFGNNLKFNDGKNKVTSMMFLKNKIITPPKFFLRHKLGFEYESEKSKED